jgi:hypothetical protein
MSPLQGFYVILRKVQWARAHGYIVPPRSELNRKNGVWSHLQPAESQTQGCKNAASRTPNGVPENSRW